MIVTGAKAATLRSLDDLRAAGLLAPGPDRELDEVAARYAVAITPTIAGLIDRHDPADPIARQFVPSAAELATLPQERADPIGDAAHSPLEGIVHRYPDRVLLKLVSVCAVYCRFCFRREMVGPGHGSGLTPAALQSALDYIAARPEIWEVVVTGGDPFMLGARRLGDLMAQLARIAHVKIVRFHTRVPMVLPERIDGDFVGALKSGGKTVYVAVHANHPREFSDAARAACASLVDAGIPLLGQTVLLAGVNDDAATLAELMRAFVEWRIKPYYLHHGDLAPGTAHFRTTIAAGRALMRALQGSVSGLCQPHYVLDIPGGHGKAPIGPAYLTADETSLRVQDYQGVWHAYADGAEPEATQEP
jgi:lysine 2,3-aminomutase